MTKVKVKFLLKDSYLASIKNSVGSEIFKNYYCQVGNQKKDLTRNGELSCAYFVSSVLKFFNLIKGIHLTVKNAIKDMEKSNWVLIKKPKAGAVIIWEEREFGPKDKHSHMGFYLGKNLAVSNSSQKRKIINHHWSFRGKRKIVAVYYHKKIGK